jgi:hypothetical protein
LRWKTSVEQTYDAAKAAVVRGVPGDFVECGVYAGAQAAIMAGALLEFWEFGDEHRRKVLGCRRAVVDYFQHSGPAPILFRKHE